MTPTTPPRVAPSPMPMPSIEPTGPAGFRLSIRGLMIASIGIAVLFAPIFQAIRSGQAVDIVLAVLVVGLAVGAGGVAMALRSSRFSAIGWLIFCLGPTVVGVGLIGISTDFDIYFVVAVILYILPVLAGVAVRIAGRRRATQQEAMLWVLAIAAGRDRPLGPAIAGLAAQSVGPERLRTTRVAECLDRGLALPEALDFVAGSAKAPARLLVRVGQESGRLVEALREAAAMLTRTGSGPSIGNRVSYLCLVGLILQGVACAAIYRVSNNFEAIFNDFGIPLPEVTKALIAAARWASGGVRLPILVAAEGLAIAALPFAFAGYAELNVPLIDRLFLRRHATLIFRCLALVVAGDRPIGPGLALLGRSYPTRWVRERLAGVALASERGHDWADGLRKFGLITRTDLALLESSGRAGNLPWALDELAGVSARRLADRTEAIGQVATTLALIGLGGFVALFGAAYFTPLIAMITHLSRFA